MERGGNEILKYKKILNFYNFKDVDIKIYETFFSIVIGESFSMLDYKKIKEMKEVEEYLRIETKEGTIIKLKWIE